VGTVGNGGKTGTVMLFIEHGSGCQRMARLWVRIHTTDCVASCCSQRRFHVLFERTEYGSNDFGRRMYVDDVLRNRPIRAGDCVRNRDMTVSQNAQVLGFSHVSAGGAA
jgi:hypothetical protein